MKILIVDNSGMATDGKGHYYTNNLNGLFIKDLIDCGNVLTYYQFAVDGSKSISVFDLQRNGVRCIPARLIKNKLLRYIKAYWNLAREIRKSDFVYFYYPGSFKFATFICRIFGIKYGLYIRGMNGINSKLSHQIYKGAFTVFTVSDLFTNMVNKVVGKNLANTIRPMIPYTDDDIITDRTYSQKEEYHLLYLGRIAEDKGIIELIEAIKTLKDKSKYKFTLEIVGNGEYCQQACSKTKELGVEDIVHFKGAVYDDNIKKEIFKKSDIYILPTYHEGFPRTLYEAMLFGTPIITTFVGGIPSLMKDNVNCLQIEPKSKNSIVEKLEYAMSNYSSLGKLAFEATNTVRRIVDKNRLTHGQHLNKIITYER